MVSNPVIEAIKSRRSIRSYQDKPVPEEAVQTMLEAATYAPTGWNQQPWRFTIVTSKTMLKHLSDASKQARLQALPDIAGEDLEKFRTALKNPHFDMFYAAPLVVFISGPKSVYAIHDCTMAAQNMMLSAYTMGIGSCWVAGASVYANTSNGKAELGVLEDHQVYCMLCFGYPKGDFPKAPEKSPPQVLKWIS